MLLLHLAYSEEDLKFKSQNSNLNARQYTIQTRDAVKAQRVGLEWHGFKV
jgi:hypothetical protein